jgi:hypothetical protein
MAALRWARPVPRATGVALTWAGPALTWAGVAPTPARPAPRAEWAGRCAAGRPVVAVERSRTRRRSAASATRQMPMVARWAERNRVRRQGRWGVAEGTAEPASGWAAVPGASASVAPVASAGTAGRAPVPGRAVPAAPGEAVWVPAWVTGTASDPGRARAARGATPAPVVTPARAAAAERAARRAAEARPGRPPAAQVAGPAPRPALRPTVSRACRRSRRGRSGAWRWSFVSH